ncbi:MAG TPA: hypothetical protein VKG01_05635 [Thermoanaerobaculia bacterium]|nr:hypothetical protein [Thermoanaerobaculia bacterium]
MRQLAGFLLLGLARAVFAADSDSCTPINAVPFTISQPGAYCLNKDIATSMNSQAAILIEASDVTLDLHGFRLGDEAAGVGTQAVGVFAGDRQNITVRNGTIKGFAIGIGLEKVTSTGVSRGHLIEKVRLEANTWISVVVFGSASVIRSNQIIKTGGSTAFGNISVAGIAVVGASNRVIDNDVFETVPMGTFSSFAINLVGSDNVVESNRIGNSALLPTPSMAIAFDCCYTGGLVINNRITTMTNGILYGPSTGKYRDNVTSGVTYPYGGGTDLGNNN